MHLGCKHAGMGLLSVKDIEEILAAKDRRKLGMTAPAEGLCLLDVYKRQCKNHSVKSPECSIMKVIIRQEE